MNQFPVTRIVTQKDGRSTFVDDQLELQSAGEIGLLSHPVDAESLMLRANPPDYDYDWHTAPRRQFILMLTGRISITVGTGETRDFGPGEVLWVEDTWGGGHKTWNSGNAWRMSAFVPVAGAVPFLGEQAATGQPQTAPAGRTAPVGGKTARQAVRTLPHETPRDDRPGSAGETPFQTNDA